MRADPLLFAFRSCTVADITYKHLSLRGDSIAVLISKAKNDQEGAKGDFERHLYANPRNPDVCLFLAMALHVVCNPSDTGHIKLFGKATHKAFSAWLAAVLNSKLTDAQKLQLGSDLPNVFGTHSCRKGAVSHCGSMPGGPSGIALFLRAGWSLGDVVGRYLFMSENGDHFVGRTVAGLLLNECAVHGRVVFNRPVLRKLSC